LNSREIISITVLLVLSIIVYLKFLYSIAYYIVIACTGFLTLIYYFSSKYSIQNSIDLRSLGDTPTIYVVIVSTIVWFILGLFTGFGLNTYIIDPIQYALFLSANIVIIILIELNRHILVNKFFHRVNWSYFLLLVLYTTIIYSIFNNIDFTTVIGVLELTVLGLYNTLYTTTAWFYGFKTHTILALTYGSLYRLSPILLDTTPRTGYMFTGFLLLIATFTIYFYHIRRRSRENAYGESGLKKRFSSIIYMFSFIALIIAIIGFVLGYRGLVVVSNSMYPVFQRGDIVVIDTNGMDHINKSDIVAFIVKDKIIIHRVVGEENRRGEILYSTKGDANNNTDPWIIHREQIIGRYVYMIPLIGYPTIYLAELVNDGVVRIGLTTVIILLITLLYIIRDMVYYFENETYTL
jgi:signal peptidase